MAYKTIVEDNIDILVAGAGLGGTGAGAGHQAKGKEQRKALQQTKDHGAA